ncbi:MAG: non-hydrolyzing UDP-N-acetylglucosamine 2-epimerase [Candidatus Heimdallarchaeaceae archaeon]
MKILVISGARPQFIKLAPIIKQILKEDDMELIHLHTGQHFDENMSKIFFSELNIPPPDINLNINRGSHAELVGKMLIDIEKVLSKEKPDAVFVAGDTNSTIAGGIAAIKLLIPVIHLESGLRSFDYRMPEEINRRLTDHLSTLLITTSSTATNTLLAEGIKEDWIFQTGDTMVDVVLNNFERAKVESKILETLNLTNQTYFLLTLHRQENVDNKERLESILRTLIDLNHKIVYPIHPRTRNRVEEFKLNHLLKSENILLTEPLGYLDFIQLQENASIILTDSGGIQKEALTLKVPCITLRDNTEWVETLEQGTNILVGAEREKIIDAVSAFTNKQKVEKINWTNPYGDGKSSEGIVKEVLRRFKEGKMIVPTHFMVK